MRRIVHASRGWLHPVSKPGHQTSLFLPAPDPTDEFVCNMMDPPWWETGGGKIKRGADRHYPLIKTKDMPQVIYDSGVWNPATSAHLWMWVTNNFLEDGLWLMKRLGFRYITNSAWIKLRNRTIADLGLTTVSSTLQIARFALQIGLGQYLRGSHELLLFGVKGNTMKPAKAPPSVFFAERGEHSEKPAASYEIIENITPGPRVELFARSNRLTWTSWGNEIQP